MNRQLPLLILLPFLSFSQINTSEIKIARDNYGVPHIFAPTDAQVAYGLAWAHAEDDFKTLQFPTLAGKGMLAQLNGKDGATIDYVVGLLRTQQTAKEKISTLSPDFLKVVEGYVAGINAYAAKHPEEILVKNTYPIKVEDYLSSVLLSLSVISGVDGVLSKIFKGEMPGTSIPKGSNAFAFSSLKTKDGATYLNINSHQPLEGPVAWYEAHLSSEEGWNMLGGLFPGGCTVFVGTNENLGWGHTVNHQDKIDVFQLTMKDTKSNLYKFDGEWLELEERKVKMKVKMGFLKIPVSKKAYWSKYGATLKTDNGVFSVRLGANQDVRGIEQWYRMNKASNFDEFYKAMVMVAIPGFNTVYADNNDNIFYVDNGKIPFRNPAYDWKGVVPGDTSATLWSDFHPLKDLPQYFNPKAGYLYNSNNTVFRATAPDENLKPEDFDPTMGYPTNDNNRSMRFAQLIAQYDKVDYEDFKRIKYDGQYPSKFYFPTDINALMQLDSKAYPSISKEIELLHNWDRKSGIENIGAGFFSLFAHEVYKSYGSKEMIVSEAEIVGLIEKTKSFMIEHFGTTEKPLGEVQKLVRGDKAIPLPNLPDVLAAMYSQEWKDGVAKGVAGDSYIQLVKYEKGKLPQIESVNCYGASNHPDSPHYDDQMVLFVNKKTKKMTLVKEEILKTAERVYSPE